MSPPFYSIVIPTYNRARLLERALASVWAQKCQDFEIIIVDNSSTDNTDQVLGNCHDSRLSVIRVQNHGNIAYSRNRGINRARGDWIAFLDSDDVWLPNKLETVQNEIINNPNAILLCHNVWTVTDKGKKRQFSCLPSISNIHENLLFKRNCIVTSATTLRRDIAVKTGGFSEKRELISVEDIDYWIRLSDVGEFCFIDELLGELHIHRDSGRKNVELHANASIHMGEYHFRLWLNENPGSVVMVRKARGKRRASAAHTVLKGNNFLKAREYAISAISLYPFNWKAWVVLILSVLHFSR